MEFDGEQWTTCICVVRDCYHQAWEEREETDDKGALVLTDLDHRWLVSVGMPEL